MLYLKYSLKSLTNNLIWYTNKLKNSIHWKKPACMYVESEFQSLRFASFPSYFEVKTMHIKSKISGTNNEKKQPNTRKFYL